MKMQHSSSDSSESSVEHEEAWSSLPPRPLLWMELSDHYDELGNLLEASRRSLVELDIGDGCDWGDVDLRWSNSGEFWGFGNDIDGYWKIERVFCENDDLQNHQCVNYRVPIMWEISFDEFGKLVQDWLPWHSDNPR